jgi:2,4-dienoyl-CoA reductase-like NADH-dependent reductase (Old Yellow Enzyme family)
MMPDAIFEPLQLGSLKVKNRVMRSSVAGRFDNYDGAGTQVRVNWDLKFARGGVGAIISSNAPIHGHGSFVPGYAHIDSDESIPRPGPRAETVHVLQQVPLLVHRASARLLRTGTVRLPRGDDRGGAVGLRGGG